VVAVLLSVTVCLSIIGPIAAKVLSWQTTPPLPDAVIAGLFDLLKVMVGGVIGWLAAAKA